MAVSKYLHVGRNPLSAFLKGIAFELEEARDSMFSTLNAMAIYGADGKYLDLWGDYIGVKRTESESDNDYAHRIPPAKKLYLSNDGPNAVYIEFGDSPVPISASTSLKLELADGLQLFSVQSNKLSAITASGETASLRVGICR